MTIAGVLFLAVIDSINPSAILVTLYLLSMAGARALVQVAVYVGAIFITYLLLGVMLVLGIESLLPSLSGVLRGRTGLVAQSFVGLLLLLAYSLTASNSRQSSPVVSRPSASTYAALVMLGVSVTAMELPTAIPYLAAIALMSEAGLPMLEWAPLLGMYNVILSSRRLPCWSGILSCRAGWPSRMLPSGNGWRAVRGKPSSGLLVSLEDGSS